MNGRVRDMTKGPYAKTIVVFALPLMLGNVFQQLYTVTDAAIVGRYVSVSALASLGAADWLNWMVLGVIMGFTQGFSIVVSQRFGAGDESGLRKAVAMSVLLSAALAVSATALAHTFLRPLLLLLRTPEEIIAGSVSYLRIFFSAIPIVTAYNLFSSILRALGNGRTPLYAMIIASLMNIGLDLLFVVVLKWGIVGAAAATVIAQLFAAIFCLTALLRIPILRMEKGSWKPELSCIGKLVRISIPVAAQNTIIGVGGVAVQYIINSFGFLFVAGFTATNKLYGILEIAAISFGYSASTFCGQNLGAQKYRRIKEGVRSTCLMAACTSLVIMAIMLLFGENILHLFVSGEEENAAEVLRISFYYLKVMAVPLPILYLLHVYRSSLQGLGNTLMPMISGIAELVMRVSSVIVLPRIAGEFSVFYAEPLAWTAALIILASSYYVMRARMPEQKEPV